MKVFIGYKSRSYEVIDDVTRLKYDKGEGLIRLERSDTSRYDYYVETLNEVLYDDEIFWICEWEDESDVCR